MNDQHRKAYDFFAAQGFIPVGRESYPVYRAYTQYSELQEMSATMIVTWSFAHNGLYKIINGCLCTVFFYDGKPVYFSIHRPLDFGKCPLQETIDILYDLSQRAALPSLQIKLIDERYLGEFEAIRGYEIKTEYNRDDCEYIYQQADFLETGGAINAKKRARLNKCFNNKSLAFNNITNKNVGICLDIEENWCTKKDCAACASFLGCEKIAMKTMVELFDERVFRGMLLYVDGIPQGYAIGEVINEKIAFGYFGKALKSDYFVYCMYKMSKDGYHEAEYVNCSDDLGNQGLRTFKCHLGLYSLWNRYICTFTKQG